MSIRSLNSDLEITFDRLMEKIEDNVDEHGLDPASKEVLDCVEYWFGGSVRDGFSDWMAQE